MAVSGSSAQQVQSRTEDPLGKIRPWVIGAVTAGLAAMLACAASATINKLDLALGLRVFGFGVLIASASLGGGFFLGFLFGIPKIRSETTAEPATTQGATGQTVAPKSAAATAPASAERAFTMPNTNLQEISDWLTKAIVGITLATSTQLYGLLKTFAAYMDKGIGWEPHGGPYSLVVFAFFGAVGFIFGWLVTGIYISRWLSTTNREIRQGEKGQPIPDTLAFTPKKEWSDTEKRAVNVTLEGGPPAPTASANEIANYAKALAAEGHLKIARDFFVGALLKEPRSADVKTALAIVDARLGDPASAMQSLTAARSDADELTAGKIDGDMVYTALYELPPNGYERAINLGEKLLEEQPNRPDSLWIHTLLAAAYGQKYRYLVENKGTDEQLKAVRDAAYNHAREGAKDKRWKVVLQQLCDPLRFGGNPRDNDLVVFANEDEFKKLLDL